MYIYSVDKFTLVILLFWFYHCVRNTCRVLYSFVCLYTIKYFIYRQRARHWSIIRVYTLSLSLSLSLWYRVIYEILPEGCALELVDGGSNVTHVDLGLYYCVYVYYIRVYTIESFGCVYRTRCLREFHSLCSICIHAKFHFQFFKLLQFIDKLFINELYINIFPNLNII